MTEAFGRSGSGWPVALLAALAMILLVNPVGFIGGGWDDWQYLNAARCWVEHGPCLPRDHWQGRWPIVAPLAASIALLGESRLSVGLPSFLYAMGCLALAVRLGNRLAGAPMGWISALLLLVMPMFAVELLDPNVEHPELFFVLASAAFIVEYRDRRNPWFAFSAGMAWSLAFQVRETAAVALPLLALAAWHFARRDGRALIAAAAGTALPIMIEMVTFLMMTGDPLWRRHLSMAHIGIASTELRAPVGSSRLPFFASDIIANWRHEPGVHVHWTIDGLVNLLVNAKAGLTIPLGLLLLAAFGPRLPAPSRRLAISALLITLFWVCGLIYALAVDPKARMMFVPATASALAVAILLHDRWTHGSRLLAGVVLSVCGLAGLAILAVHPEVRTSEPKARQWIARYPSAIEADLNTRRHLALAGGDVMADVTAQRPLLLIKLGLDCEAWARGQLPSALRLVDQSLLGKPGAAISSEQAGRLCLFAYRRPTSSEAVMRAKVNALKMAGRDVPNFDRN